MSARKIVVRTTSAKERSAARSSAPTLARTRRVCAATSPSIIWPVAGSMGIWPEMNSSCPARTAGEYGPMAAGASGLETACFIIERSKSGCLDDLLRAQAPGADLEALDPAVDHGAHQLQ